MTEYRRVINVSYSMRMAISMSIIASSIDAPNPFPLLTTLLPAAAFVVSRFVALLLKPSFKGFCLRCIEDSVLGR